MPHRPLAALLAVLLALVLAACGGSDDDAVAPATSSEAVEASAPSFPVLVEGDNGPLEIEEQPEAIVSLSPTATESLFAIGAGDQVIAVDDQSNYPAEAPVTDLSGFQPNVEAIAGYEPDLVVASYDPGGLVKGLEKLDIPVLLQDAAPDLEGAYDQIETLGAATGNAEGAEVVVESMRTEIERLAASVPTAAGTTVYHELGPDFFTATSDTFIGSVYAALRAREHRRRRRRRGRRRLSPAHRGVHRLRESRPHRPRRHEVLRADGRDVAKRAGWDQIAAVANGDIVEADDDIASRWGPRTVDFVELIVAVLEGMGSPE